MIPPGPFEQQPIYTPVASPVEAEMLIRYATEGAAFNAVTDGYFADGHPLSERYRGGLVWRAPGVCVAPGDPLLAGTTWDDELTEWDDGVTIWDPATSDCGPPPVVSTTTGQFVPAPGFSTLLLFWLDYVEFFWFAPLGSVVESVPSTPDELEPRCDPVPVTPTVECVPSGAPTVIEVRP